MAEQSKKQTLVVIGAGPGGYPAAFRAAQLGLQVTMIDPRARPGGVCLFEGCIPSKTLLHVARLLHETREAERWGIKFAQPQIDLQQLGKYRDEVIDKLAKGASALTKRLGVNLIAGKASFADSHHVTITDEADHQRTLEFDDAIIATGSQPIILPNMASDSSRVMDSSAALELRDIPPRLLVVGGGYIGLELGTVYEALGSKVTVVEMTQGLLPGVDRDLVEVLQRRLQSQFDAILLNTRVEDVQERDGRLLVRLAESAGPVREMEVDKVLVAVGRQPRTQGLRLENAGVQVDDQGFIEVDRERRTSADHIFAIGDVVGEPMLAHKATYEGRIAAEVIAGEPSVYDPAAVPAVVFTDPEIAWAGLTEAQAKQQGVDVQVARFPWAASGRAVSIDRSEGLTKLLIEPRTQRVLGVGVVGVGAGELIGEGTLAVETGALAGDILWTIHAHPTLSETMMEAAGALLGMGTHFQGPREPDK
jgi:dihydrolipoamide dehydrogenase